MAQHASMKELLNMSVDDVRRDVREQRATVAKLSMGIRMGKEKNSALYKREKRQIARMLTVLTQKRRS
ncbi:50S ribosomal protein L29, partial [Candidatus Peribacteria bacterium]|nr:50S ribosomal protein L29 [Candidatus Peribacteria bacterium]